MTQSSFPPDSPEAVKTVQPISETTKWREDFPVDVPEDAYVSRREFVKFLVLISGAFAVGQLWIAWLARGRRKNLQGRGYPRLKIADAASVPIGGYITFHYPNPHATCFLIRTGEADFVAYDNKCTHLMCPVIPQPEKNELFCPCHKGHFDLISGRPLAGPPRRPLARVQLEIRNGVVYAVGMEHRVV